MLHETKLEAVQEKIQQLSDTQLDDLIQYLDIKVNLLSNEVDLLKHLPNILKEDEVVLKKLAQ
jgi:hypothetical protein